MAVFKCKLCGGVIEVRENGIGVCDSCGTKQTIPNTNDEKKMNLLDRANHFRMQNDFDKAISIYEQVLDEDVTDSDVYYSIALCRYGITYVDDSKTGKKIPTINRLQNKRFTEDADYLMAVKCAESSQMSLYNDEGAYIDKVQQGIMDITKNEKPYDIFICYKETDESGNRTHDSVLANDLYYGLVNEGFKVFFARITLEGKLGVAYEPYIFSALQSSKVMVVLGTKPEYFNAVWVKNEWSRFLSLINDGANKTLIPAYKDMDPYDLPDEFANLQAQDMSKLGFMQDLIRGIKKIVGSQSESDGGMVGGGNEKVVGLLKRVKIFLGDSDFKKADEYCEKALDIDAENSDIYLYKLLVENQCASLQELLNVDNNFEDVSKNYKNAIKFANETQKQKLEEIANEHFYNKADRLSKSGQHLSAISLFEKIKGFRDSDKRIEEVTEQVYKSAMNNKDKGDLEKAIKKFNEIINYKDSKEQVDECIYIDAVKVMSSGKYSDLISAASKFDKIIKYKDADSKRKECFELVNDSIYNDAIKMIDEKLYKPALLNLENIMGYKDVKEKIEYCRDKIYNEALTLMKDRLFYQAIDLFTLIPNYNGEIDKKVVQCYEEIKHEKYEKANKEYNLMHYDYALSIYKEILDYRDVKLRFLYCVKQTGKQSKYAKLVAECENKLAEEEVNQSKERKEQIKQIAEQSKEVLGETIVKTKSIVNAIGGFVKKLKK